jgi:hypothetical protein
LDKKLNWIKKENCISIIDHSHATWEEYKKKMLSLGSKLDLIPSHMKLIKKLVKRNPLMSLYW